MRKGDNAVRHAVEQARVQAIQGWVVLRAGILF